MQNFFVEIKHDQGADYLKTTAEDRESLLKTPPETLGCPLGAITKAVEVGTHEFENLPASTIKTSAGLFHLVVDKTNGRYGAPMGRKNWNECPISVKWEPGNFRENELWYNIGKTFDRTVPLDGQGYDAGGAYWGRGTELRVEYNSDLTFVRFYRR